MIDLAINGCLVDLGLIMGQIKFVWLAVWVLSLNWLNCYVELFDFFKGVS
jgi:hypothetical protein